jgi:hypothetical protein
MAVVIKKTIITSRGDCGNAGVHCVFEMKVAPGTAWDTPGCGTCAEELNHECWIREPMEREKIRQASIPVCLGPSQWKHWKTCVL